MAGSQQVSLKPTKYFVQCEVDGSCFAFYRQRYEAKRLVEECWWEKSKEWKHIPGRLIWMQISGECTLAEVSYLEFRRLLPEAFEDGNR